MRNLFFVLAFTVCSILFFGQDASDERIAFHSDRDGNDEIYIMNTDGSNQTRLTDNPERDKRPSLSPDGSKIVYISEIGGLWDLFTMNSDGTNNQRLTNTNSAPWTLLDPSWSPDGQKIVFTLQLDSNQNSSEVFLVKSDGTDLEQVTYNDQKEKKPCFTPDGANLIFAKAYAGASNTQIYKLNLETGEEIRLTSEPGNNHYASVSPDGTKIAFQSWRTGGGVFQLWLMNLDGSNQIRLTTSDMADECPAWSPDGTKIAFHAYDYSRGKRQLYMINSDGTGRTRLTDNTTNDLFPSWSNYCIEGIRAKDQYGGKYLFNSIQEAVNHADEEWTVEVGSGSYYEKIQIIHKSNLVIQTTCNAIVKGFDVKRSSNVTIHGFEIDPSISTGKFNGVNLLHNNNITIRNCKIHNTKPCFNGIRIGRNNQAILIINNHIYQNGRNGILFNNATAGTNQINLVTFNLIEENSWNGIKVGFDHVVRIENNIIQNNGTKERNPGGGGAYGILAVEVGGSIDEPWEITLIDNTIINNKGKEKINCSQDLGNYNEILDETDNGNITTCGCEG